MDSYYNFGSQNSLGGKFRSRWSGAFFLLMALVIACSGRSALASYIFSSSLETYSSLIDGTVLVGNTTVDNSSYTVDLDFPFPFGVSTFKQLNISTNGGIVFGAANFPEYLPVAYRNNVIVPFGEDLIGRAGYFDTLRYQTTGREPDRVLTIEWKNWGLKKCIDQVLINFQLKLHENGVIEFCYGDFVNERYSLEGQIGFRCASEDDFYTRTTKTDWNATTAGGLNSTALVTYFVKPAKGLTFKFSTDTNFIVKFNTMGGIEIRDVNFGSALQVELQTEVKDFYFFKTLVGGDTLHSEKLSYPAYSGHTFAGWFFDSTFKNEAHVINQDTTLYARWLENQYHIAFNTAGGSKFDTIILTQCNNGKDLNPYIVISDGKFYFMQFSYPGKWIGLDTFLFPTRSGYTFAGWFSDSTFNNKAGHINQDTTLYAKWVTAHKVTFNTQGGSSIDDYFVSGFVTSIDQYPKLQLLDSGFCFEQIIYPGTWVYTDTIPYPTRPGYTFAGWYFDPECSQQAFRSSSFLSISGDTVLYAKWIDSIKITLNTMGGEKISDYYIVDASYSTLRNAISGYYFESYKYFGGKISSTDVLPYPTRSGFSFAGWYFDAEYKYRTDIFITNPVLRIDCDTVLYAKWNPAYKITFDSRGGSEIASIELVQFNQNENYRPFMLTTPSGFYFMQNPYTGSNYIYDWISSDTIRFPTRAGFEFEGWYFDSTYWFPAENKYANGYPAFSQDTVLYAKWKDLSSVENTDGRGIFALTLDQRSEICLIQSLSGKYFDKIRLFDASGHSMEISNDYTSQKEIDISRLSCGKYFVEIRSGGKNYLLDFVITR